MSEHHEIQPEERSAFERPATLRLIWITVPLLCGVFAAMNIGLAVLGKTHPHFRIDAFPVFYGVVGFLSFSFIVLVGQHLRKILMREEGYYEGDEARLPRHGTDESVGIDDMAGGDER